MKKPSSQIVVYQAKNGAIELRGDVAKDTIWASLDQIAEVFERDKSVVSRHIKNVFTDGEIAEKSNVQKMHNATFPNLLQFFP